MEEALHWPNGLMRKNSTASFVIHNRAAKRLAIQGGKSKIIENIHTGHGCGTKWKIPINLLLSCALFR